MGGELAEFGGNGAVICAERQNVLFIPYNPAGICQRRRNRFLKLPLQGGKQVRPVR